MEKLVEIYLLLLITALCSRKFSNTTVGEKQVRWSNAEMHGNESKINTKIMSSTPGMQESRVNDYLCDLKAN